MKRLRIALIGSRALHEEPGHEQDIELMHKICYRFACLGITFTSGLCHLGMDAIAQKEYSRAVNNHKAFLSQFEVYVYGIKAIHKSTLPNKHLAIISNKTMAIEAEKLAASVHRNWNACGPYAKSQHMRNTHQILGFNLNEPVDAVVTWCKLDNYGEPMGGTATALRIARKHNIPVFNLYQTPHDEFKNQIAGFLKSKKVHGLKNS